MPENSAGRASELPATTPALHTKRSAVQVSPSHIVPEGESALALGIPTRQVHYPDTAPAVGAGVLLRDALLGILTI